MQRIFSSFLVLGLGLTSVIAPLPIEPVCAQNQPSQSDELQQVQELLQILVQAEQQTQQGKSQQAIETWQQVLKLSQQLQNKQIEALALVKIGFNLIAIGQSQKALVYFNQGLPIIQTMGDRIGEAFTLTGIGSVYNNLGQPQKALEYFNRSLSISQKMGDRIGEAFTLTGIGSVHNNLGQFQKALEYFNRSLPISQKGGDQAGEATMLNNIGLVYNSIGQPQRALEYFNRSLPIWQALGNRAGEALTLNNIGEVYRAIGQPQKGLDYHNRALPNIQALGDRRSEARTLNNIGLAYSDIGQSQKALEYLSQALPIWQAIGDQTGEAGTLNNIGGVYSTIGQPQKALAYFNQTLPIIQTVGNRAREATTLNNIGQIYSDIGQFQKALAYFNQTLPITQAVGDKAGEATTLRNMGFVYQDTNRPIEAITNWEQSIKLTLQIRSGLVRENRPQFQQVQRGTAVALASLLIARGATDRAYEWVNRTATADLADYARLLNAKVANPEAQAAIDQWNQQNQQLQFLRQRLQEKFSEDLARQIRTLEAQVIQQGETLARRFPEAANLFETTPTDLAQLKASIPDGTTVIHPVLLTGIQNVPNTIAFFILTRDKLTVIQTPIDPKAFEALLTATVQQLNNRFDDQYLDNLAKLYDSLIRPIEAQIQATQPKQLSIIATGKLRYLPFETLYDQKAEQYLIQKYPVSYLTRLSSRSLASQNQQTATATKSILAIGNPVSKDPWDLPATETEVQDIVKTISGSEAMIREQATLAAFKLQALRFPWLHLATHGCFRPQGCCLGTPEECQKSPRIDLPANTILFADQPFNIANAALLGLQNVDLITLSACQTALETNSNGEEIAGLAYLFERAGAKATIASLWSAEDTTTQAIMVQFYQNLKQGMSKGEALQKAKLSQVASHPFFWAPFVLIGDAR